MHVFLTGATGYLGTAVAGALRRAGHEVSRLARSPDAEAKLRSAGVRPVAGSLHDLPALARAAGEGAGAGERTTAWPLAEARRSLGSLADALALDQRAAGARARALGWQPRAHGILETLRSGQ